jgi:hypothetical protein
MASFNKFNIFTYDALAKKHDFTADTFKVALSNSAPTASNAVLADITQISAGNGYTSGGTATSMSLSTSSGTAKATGTDVVFTASGGSIGPARYAVLYNDTATGDPLVGWWDYGSSITLAATETLTVDFDASNGILTIV